MSVKLPSRYEDLDQAFRGRLRPVPSLIDEVQKARKSMLISGGLRFLPIFGESGSGKSSAARELGTHLPETRTVELPRSAINSIEALREFLRVQNRAAKNPEQLLIAVVDQYEEAVASRTDLPSQFVEWLSLLDRDREFNRTPSIFLWLTTSKEFQKALQTATSRNRRILAAEGFELSGPGRADWSAIIEETFEAHNEGRSLADFGVLRSHIEEMAVAETTIGATIERTGEILAQKLPTLQDLSVYQVLMIWPVTDGQKINTILRFVDGRAGYRLDWNAWYRQLNEADRQQLPLAEYNRARLYFDVRLVPIAAADLHPLCRDLDDEEPVLHQSYLDRFTLTHYASIVRGTWEPAKYAPLRERESKRATEARDWYSSVTKMPTQLGRRLAHILRSIEIQSKHEEIITSPHGTVRADVLSLRTSHPQTQVITELKAFSPENTIPSTIRDAIRTTLKRHAQFAGLLPRQ